ncbi:GNAT family N-acetyltransferase [Streptomyces sp. NPDC054796]
MYDVCVRTGHEGGDSRALYPDPELLPSIFAGPYLRLEPELAFVVEDGGRAVGYVLGTADTVRFVERYRAEWLPRFAGRYPAPTSGPGVGAASTPATWTPHDEMVALLHHPERMVLPELAGHPAHLHIDLLPSHQRSGLGRALVHRFLRALADAGVPTVHLGMVTANTSARAFYDRLGFRVLPVADPGPLTYLGRFTGAAEE